MIQRIAYAVFGSLGAILAVVGLRYVFSPAFLFVTDKSYMVSVTLILLVVSLWFVWRAWRW
jgi:hypothetical protein